MTSGGYCLVLWHTRTATNMRRVTKEGSAMIGKPKLVERAEQRYLGIRIQTPFRGMFAHVNKQLAILEKWIARHTYSPIGPRLLRYHVVDMSGEMDVEVEWSLRLHRRAIGWSSPARAVADCFLRGSTFGSVRYIS